MKIIIKLNEKDKATGLDKVLIVNGLAIDLEHEICQATARHPLPPSATWS